MADVHGLRGRVPVDPALYRHWIDSLVAMVADTDPEADERLLARWRAAMSVVCETFTRRYAT